MGLAYNIYLDSNKIYGCKNCKTHLANHDDIISRVSFYQVPNTLYTILIKGRISAANMARPTSSRASSTSQQAKQANAI
jgi:hypothetical protein